MNINKYPYTDFHELNLDWFLAQFKTLTDAWDSQQADYNKFKEDVTTEFNNLSGKFDTLEETVHSFTTFITNYFNNLDVQQEINNKLDEMVSDGTMTELIRPIFDAYAAQMTQRMNVLEGRMDTFASLPDGSTAGDAELLDIRVGGNGVTYSSAGNAVRAQYDINHAAINDLKESIGNWIYKVTNYNDWHNVDCVGEFASGDKVYIHAFETADVSYYNIVGINNGTVTTLYSNQTDKSPRIITLFASYDTIRIAYKCNTVASVTMSAVIKKIDSNAIDISGQLASVLQETKNIESQIIYIDNPIILDDKSDVAKNWLKGLIGVEIYDMQYEKYAFWYFWHNVNEYDLYINLRGFDGTTWVSLDTIQRTTAPAEQSTIETIASVNGKFRILIDWSQTPTPVNINSTDTIYYEIKDRCIVYTDFASIVVPYVNTDDYELKDSTKHIVTVKKDGTGDFTTIAAAYASITDSSFLNQYEVVVYPGTYEEYNLICPPYTHTHGLYPDTVIVTSAGVSSTLPVFDQKNAPSKLSNMTIISGTGYCVHQDANLNSVVLVNENLYCKKVYDTDVPNFSWQQKTNPAIIGDGAQYYGAKFIWKSCTFENGEVAFHSNSSSDPNSNQHVIFKDCKLVNAWFELMMAGNGTASTDSFCVAEFDGTYAPKGCPLLKCKFGTRIGNESNFVWQVIGGNNKDFSIIWDNTSDPLSVDSWKNINTNEKAYVQATASITKGQWITDVLSVCGANEDKNNVMGIALEDASIGDTFAVWTGNAFRQEGFTNGEYGIGSNGTLSASAGTKIGKVINNIFYRY